MEQLEGGHAAVVMKVHHSLTDGIGGMQLVLTLFDVDRDRPRSSATSTAPRGTAREAGLIRASLARTVRARARRSRAPESPRHCRRLHAASIR